MEVQTKILEWELLNHGRDPELTSVLDLCNLHLTELPPAIGLLSNLSFLDLQSNSLTALPSEIGRLKNLRILNVDDNNLLHIPDEIAGCENLRLLSARRNQLTDLPDFSRIPNLRGLRFDENDLELSRAVTAHLAHQWTLEVEQSGLVHLPPGNCALQRLVGLPSGENPAAGLPDAIVQHPPAQDAEPPDAAFHIIRMPRASLSSEKHDPQMERPSSAPAGQT